MNDSELVQGLRRRDPAAMQWLCDCHLPSLWRFVYTRVHGDSHLAEDITNEAILAMLTAIQSSDGDSNEILNPAGWLRTVAGRRVSDHFRAAARVRSLIEEQSGNQTDRDEADPAIHHQLQESRAQVREVMDSLPDQQRLALEWKYLDKLSVREMAGRWETTVKAVESILFRARREFRDRLEKPSANESSRNGKRPISEPERDEAPHENASH